jgi:hypothetical protein
MNGIHKIRPAIRAFFYDLSSYRSRYCRVLRRRHGVAAPYNEAIYDLYRREFARPKLAPMEEKQVCTEAAKKL